MRIHYRALFFLTLAVIVGCSSSQPPPITYYLLRDAQLEEGLSQVDRSARSVGIGRIVVAPYLLGAKGIMLETTPGAVRPASLHQWAEPLDVGLIWYLRSAIGDSMRAGEEVGGGLADRLDWDYAIEVSVARMHGTMEGRALLEAEFVISPRDRSEPPIQSRFAKSIPLADEGYPALVEAQKTLLSEFAGEIGVAIDALVQAREASSEG